MTGAEPAADVARRGASVRALTRDWIRAWCVGAAVAMAVPSLPVLGVLGGALMGGAACVVFRGDRFPRALPWIASGLLVTACVPVVLLTLLHPHQVGY